MNASQDIESIKNKSNDIIPSKDGLIDDENNELQPSDESDISTNINNVDEINKDLRKNDGITRLIVIVKNLLMHLIT